MSTQTRRITLISVLPTHAVLTVLLTFGAMTTSTANAQTFGDIGASLKQACRTGTGGTELFAGIQFGGTKNLQWICSLASAYRFIEKNLINGDWQGFMADVAGKYITDLADYATSELGMGEFSDFAEDTLYEMRGTYAEFKRSILGAMRTALAEERNRKDDNDGLSDVTAGGLADQMAKQSPTLSGAQTAGRVGQTVDKFRQVDKAYRAKKLMEENQEALADNVAPAIAAATAVVGAPQIPGMPTQPGTADELNNKARTALSSREVLEVSVEAATETMKMQAVMSTAVLNQLSEIAKQQVMTNNQLLLASNELSSQSEIAQHELKAYLEEVAQDTLFEAKEAAGVLRTATDVGRILTDSAFEPADLEGFIP